MDGEITLPMIPLEPTAFASKAVHSIGYEPIKSGLRGNIHVQFHREGEFTSRGYFANAQRNLFHGLQNSPKPGKFINENLKGHFRWVRTDGGVDTEAEGGRALTADELARLPKELYFPANLPNTMEAFEECFQSQLLKPTGALF